MDLPKNVFQSLLLAIEAFVTFLVLDLLLIRWPFEKVYRRMVASPRPRASLGPNARKVLVAQIVGGVAIANRFYYRRKQDCLPRSLTLCRLLRSHHVPADFCLGVKKYPFRAHAWVECEGELIDDWPQRVGTYKLITRLRAPSEP